MLQWFPWSHDLMFIDDAVDDAVDAIMAVMQLGTSQPISINVGSGKDTSHTQVSQLFKKPGLLLEQQSSAASEQQKL